MRLSIVIVNYNVKYFLKQCLRSVYGSDRTLADGSGLELDVWVVDNDSVDGSVEMLRRDFPQVHLIANTDNVGFARANNMALREVAKSFLSGEVAKSLSDGVDKPLSHSATQPLSHSTTQQLILLLNPDTVVERDTLVRCADFMAAHADCGGLCVKMVDGHGRFLKESKRGFPTPQASFFKLSGLIHLFPRSRKVAAYYMGHLPDDEVNPIEIMPGAFMMLRGEVYDKIGGLDESYFMYGEDIDYSWRIRLAGWQNYYLPTTRIIHYKGESTKKGSMNYVYTFYNAMAIFVGRYFSGRSAKAYGALLRMAIWLRATLAWVARLLRGIALPVADFAAAYGGFVLLKGLWQQLNGYPADYYPPQYAALVIPLYILVLMATTWMGGGYDRPVRAGRIARGMGAGVLLLLAFYSLLDETRRYSRMLLLMGSAWTLVSTLGIRGLLAALGVPGFSMRQRAHRGVLVVGEPQETARVRELYASLGQPTDTLAECRYTTPAHLQDLIRIERADEVVFCGRDMEMSTIIGLMARLRTTGVEYKIAPAGDDFIIGSESILSADELLLADLDTISTDAARRSKRMFDIGTSLLLLVLSPVLFWPQRRKRQYFGHCLRVLGGGLTWVGYTGHRGVFAPRDLMPSASDELAERIMLRYMRHYRTSTDWTILLRNWRNI